MYVCKYILYKLKVYGGTYFPVSDKFLCLLLMFYFLYISKSFSLLFGKFSYAFYSLAID